MKVGHGAVIIIMCAGALTVWGASQFVEIKKPFANIYKWLDPKSEILVQAKRGDVFELVYAGTSWYQVKYKNQVGWLERRAGEIIGDPSRVPLSTVVGFVVVLIATVGVAVYWVQREKLVEE